MFVAFPEFSAFAGNSQEMFAPPPQRLFTKVAKCDVSSEQNVAEHRDRPVIKQLTGTTTSRKVNKLQNQQCYSSYEQKSCDAKSTVTKTGACGTPKNSPFETFSYITVMIFDPQC